MIATNRKGAKKNQKSRDNNSDSEWKGNRKRRTTGELKRRHVQEQRKSTRDRTTDSKRK
jgi:hypothetical protein